MTDEDESRDVTMTKCDEEWETIGEQNKPDMEPTESKYMAISLPRLPIDDVWKSILEDSMGNGSDIKFHNRRGTGGDMHYATMTFEDEDEARTIAEQVHPPMFNSKKPITALCSGHDDPTEVEIENLSLTQNEILRQFGNLGTIVSHRIATRKMRSQLIFATHSGAKKSLKFDQQEYKGNTVNITVKKQDGQPGVPKTEKKRVLKRKGTRRRLQMRSAQFAALPEHAKDKVLNYRKIKENIILNLAETRKGLSKPESSHSPEKLAVLRGEEERLLLKQKKIKKALHKEISKYRIIPD